MKRNREQTMPPDRKIPRLWKTIPYNSLEKKLSKCSMFPKDKKFRPQFIDVLQTMEYILGPPSEIVMLNNSYVGVTSWNSVSMYEQREALIKGTGFFDASAMTCFVIRGINAVNVLNYLTPNDVSKMEVGSALFTIFTLKTGCIDDKVNILRIGNTEFWISCESCGTPTHLPKTLQKFKGTVAVPLNYVTFNLKGLRRLESLCTLFDFGEHAKLKSLTTSKFVECWNRYGGSIIIVASSVSYQLWCRTTDQYLEFVKDICKDCINFTPCGWDILNSFRLRENGDFFPLYPLDIGSHTSITEAKLDNMIDRNKQTKWIGYRAYCGTVVVVPKKKIVKLQAKSIYATVPVNGQLLFWTCGPGLPIHTIGVVTSAARELHILIPMAFALIEPSSMYDEGVLFTTEIKENDNTTCIHEWVIQNPRTM